MWQQILAETQICSVISSPWENPDRNNYFNDNEKNEIGDKLMIWVFISKSLPKDGGKKNPLISECFSPSGGRMGRMSVYAVRMFYILQSTFTCLNANVSDNELGWGGGGVLSSFYIRENWDSENKLWKIGEGCKTKPPMSTLKLSRL